MVTDKKAEQGRNEGHYRDSSMLVSRFGHVTTVPRIGDNTSQWIALYVAFPKIDSFLQQLAQLVGGQLAVSEDSVKQTGSDGLARVHRHNRPAILVT